MKHEKLLALARTEYDRKFKDELSGLSARGLELYAPHQRATCDGETTYAWEPRGPLDGRLSLDELKAVLIVHHQIGSLTRKLNQDRVGLVEVKNILGLSDFELPGEVLEGMADFIHDISHVAAVRERLKRGESMPTGTNKHDQNLRCWWGLFAERIKADDLRLGRSVAGGLVEVVTGIAARKVCDNDGVARWVSRAKGIGLAGEFYLQVLPL